MLKVFVINAHYLCVLIERESHFFDDARAKEGERVFYRSDWALCCNIFINLSAAYISKYICRAENVLVPFLLELFETSDVAFACFLS